MSVARLPVAEIVLRGCVVSPEVVIGTCGCMMATKVVCHQWKHFMLIGCKILPQCHVKYGLVYVLSAEIALRGCVSDTTGGCHQSKRHIWIYGRILPNFHITLVPIYLMDAEIYSPQENNQIHYSGV